ncbi:hypothetical protein QL285_009804 [Trifolium repens]|nr:hypothetical protein QL285_009804 [Trifolium repens]
MQVKDSSEATHQKLCKKTPDSDKSSVSRFVRRTFSATMIGIHHPLTIQIGETTLSSVIMTLVLLYEPLPDLDESFPPRLVFYNCYMIWIKYHVKKLYYL